MYNRGQKIGLAGPQASRRVVPHKPNLVGDFFHRFLGLRRDASFPDNA